MPHILGSPPLIKEVRQRLHSYILFIHHMPSNTIKGDTFFSWDGDTLVLNVLGTPSAKKDAIGKVKGHQLGISVTAAPVRGRATDHMVKFLAGEFGVSPKDITVVFGRYNVNKQLRIKAPTILPREIRRFETS